MKMKRKKKNKDITNGFVFGFALYSILFSITIAYLIFSPYFGIFIDKARLNSFNSISLDWQNNNLVSSIADACNLQKDIGMKVICVNTFICRNLNYTTHGIQDELRGSPEEIFKQGGCCRDYAVLYKSIFDKMNIPYNFTENPGHIYGEVYINNKTYILDQCFIGELK
jgi:hypothetical protein